MPSRSYHPVVTAVTPFGLTRAQPFSLFIRFRPSLSIHHSNSNFFSFFSTNSLQNHYLNLSPSNNHEPYQFYPQSSTSSFINQTPIPNPKPNSSNSINPLLNLIPSPINTRSIVVRSKNPDQHTGVTRSKPKQVGSREPNSIVKNRHLILGSLHRKISGMKNLYRRSERRPSRQPLTNLVLFYSNDYYSVVLTRFFVVMFYHNVMSMIYFRHRGWCCVVIKKYRLD